jgi:hypothetical protein
MARTSRPRLGRHLSNDILHLHLRILGELRGKVVPRVEEHPHGLLAGIRTDTACGKAARAQEPTRGRELPCKVVGDLVLCFRHVPGLQSLMNLQ